MNFIVQVAVRENRWEWTPFYSKIIDNKSANLRVFKLRSIFWSRSSIELAMDVGDGESVSELLKGLKMSLEIEFGEFDFRV